MNRLLCYEHNQLLWYLTNEYKKKELLLESLIEVPICGYVDHYLKRMVNQDVYFIETDVKPLALEVVKLM